jgi:hypothetical protein
MILGRHLLIVLVLVVPSAILGKAQDTPFFCDLLNKHNVVKENYGLNPFHYNNLLSKAAQAHAE